MSAARDEERSHRWWLRFVIVPIVCVVIGALAGANLPLRGRASRVPPPVRRELLAPGTIALLADEASPDLKSSLSLARAEVQRHDLPGALETVGSVLHEHPNSPRAHYFRACVLSLLASETHDATRQARYLDEGEGELRDALEFGVSNYIKIFLNNPAPVEWMKGDSDLVTLLSSHPGARKLLEEFAGEDHPQVAGEGPGCIEEHAKVLLTTGQWEAAGCLRQGDQIASVDTVAGVVVPGVVARVTRHPASEILCINGRIRATAAHPFRTAVGWRHAGELHPGDVMRTVGGEEEVETVVAERGVFFVVDVAVEPWRNFVVEGVVAHNKNMEQ